MAVNISLGPISLPWYNKMVEHFPVLAGKFSSFDSPDENVKLPHIRMIPAGNALADKDLEGVENAILNYIQIEFEASTKNWNNIEKYDKVSHEFMESIGYERTVGLQYMQTTNVVRAVCRYKKLETESNY